MAVRDQILAAGYQPSMDKNDTYYCDPAYLSKDPSYRSEQNDVCKKLPELQDCAGDANYCDLWFRDQIGNRLRVVITFRRTPPDGAIYFWELTCAKNQKSK